MNSKKGQRMVRTTGRDFGCFLRSAVGARRVMELQNDKEQETMFLLDLLRYSRTLHI